jgi:hypothetical protein
MLVDSLAQIQELRTIVMEQQLQIQRANARLDKLDPPPSPMRDCVKSVEARGNIRVDHTTGHVTLLRPITFVARTTKGDPDAEFKQPKLAAAIAKDIAEVSMIFGCPMLIEGHTKGGEGDFWKELANDRARKVRDLVVEFGVPPEKVSAMGVPGRLGSNEVQTVVIMDIANIGDERAPVVAEEKIINGKVVEQDIMQAGHLVERRSFTEQPAVGCDVFVDGKVVPGFYQQGPIVEHERLIGGKVVERNIYEPSPGASFVAPPPTVRPVGGSFNLPVGGILQHQFSHAPKAHHNGVEREPSMILPLANHIVERLYSQPMPGAYSPQLSVPTNSRPMTPRVSHGRALNGIGAPPMPQQPFFFK